MRNRIKMAAVAVTAAAVLAGCGPAPQGVATEPWILAETVAVATTAPAETRYQFGDIVWTLETELDGSVSPSRYAVVEHKGDSVMVTSAVSDTAEALRECLPEYIASGNAEIWAIPAAECFPSEEAALAEIARRTADELDGYWGCE